MENFTDWLDEMTNEFNNDFLGLKKSELNETLTNNQINKID